MRKAVRLIAFRKGRYNNALELGIAPIAKVVLRHTQCAERGFYFIEWFACGFTSFQVTAA
jgi:hypothetical protein